MPSAPFVQGQAGGPARLGPITDYFPVGAADSWTYDWTMTLPDGTRRTFSRTRAIEGREFINADVTAYKIVAGDGDFVLLSVDDRALRLHGSAEQERGVRFSFDPPVVLLSSDFVPGRPLVLTESDASGQPPREWTTIFEGFEGIDTPMGKFESAARVRLEMQSTDVTTRAVYYFVKQIGLVAYQYEARRKPSKQLLASVDARLRLAQLGGRPVKHSGDVSVVPAHEGGPAKGGSSARARKIFKEATEKRYTWDKNFRGFEARFQLVMDEKPPLAGTIKVDAGLHISVQCPDPTARARVQSEIAEIVNHRECRPFEETYARADFRLGREDPEQGAEIFAEGDAMGTSYRIRDDQIRQISRTYGRVRFETSNTGYVKTDDGRSIAVENKTIYYSNENNDVVNQVRCKDAYEKVGGAYLPKSRKKWETAKGKSLTLELTLSDFK